MTDMTAPPPFRTQPTDREFLTFRIGEQEYSIDIMAVREIRCWSHPTPLPHAEDHIRGVINLRGTVIPIIDLARRLAIPAEEENARNVIIVAWIRQQVVGLLVDAVSDILAIPDTDIHPPPEMGAGRERGCVRSLTIVGDRMLRILDLEAILPGTMRGAA